MAIGIESLFTSALGLSVPWRVENVNLETALRCSDFDWFCAWLCGDDRQRSFLCKTTDYYAPAHERCIAWNDQQIGIQWPEIGMNPLLSAKDLAGKNWADAEVFL